MKKLKKYLIVYNFSVTGVRAGVGNCFYTTCDDLYTEANIVKAQEEITNFYKLTSVIIANIIPLNA